MNTILSIPLRFGDPAICLTTNSLFTAFGTAYGKVSILDHTTQEILTLKEISEEYISAISLSPTNTLTFAVGDYYCNQVNNPFKSSRVLNQTYSRIHTMEDCSNCVTFINERY